MSLTEVAFAAQEKDNRALDQEAEDRISGLWALDGPVRLAEFHSLIGHEARQLIRQAILNGWKLTPLDAIHLATARRLGATEFYTYDGGLKKYESAIGIMINEPIAATPMLQFPPFPIWRITDAWPALEELPT